MVNDWETKKLSDVYDVRDGTHDSPKYIKSGYPLVTSKNLKSSGLDLSNTNLISETDYININKRSKVDVSDVLFAMIGTIGNPTIVLEEPKFAIKNVALFKVPYDQDSRFLKYYLESDYVVRKMADESKGTTQKFVGLGYLRNFPIKLPSLPEQKRIVSILDDIFKDANRAKEIAEMDLENSKYLLESFLETIFNAPGNNWEDTNLGSIAKIKGGKRVPRGYQMLKEQTNYPYIRVSDFNDDGTVNRNNLKYIDERIYDQIRNYTITDKDMYISIAGTIGKTGIIPTELNGANLTENAAKLVFEKGIYNKYVYYFTRSKGFLEQAGLSTRTTAMPKLALARLSGIRIRIPKLYSEQEIITEKIELLNSEVFNLHKVYSERLNLLALLKKSVLNKAFRGEL
jgi:type I restriction enzyme S subunit